MYKYVRFHPRRARHVACTIVRVGSRFENVLDARTSRDNDLLKGPRGSSSRDTSSSTSDCFCSYNTGNTRPSSGRRTPSRARPSGASNDTISSTWNTCTCPRAGPCSFSVACARFHAPNRNNSRRTSTFPNETRPCQPPLPRRIPDNPPTGPVHLKHKIQARHCPCTRLRSSTRLNSRRGSSCNDLRPGYLARVRSEQ